MPAILQTISVEREGIPTPMDYKQSHGMVCSEAFRIKKGFAWSAGVVLADTPTPCLYRRFGAGMRDCSKTQNQAQSQETERNGRLRRTAANQSLNITTLRVFRKPLPRIPVPATATKGRKYFPKTACCGESEGDES